MNLKSLSDFKKKDGINWSDSDEKDKDKKKTSSYTGGESSGMAVINPDVKGIMEKEEKNSK